LRPPEEIIAILRDLHPDIVGGFAGAVSQVAQLMNDDDRRIIRPRFVVVGGEVLTPLMRQQVFAAFQAPVFNLYGSHEFNLIAWQCKETGDFHTCDDGMIVEVLKGNRPASAGERGEVVGTSLHSFAMPFIRYRLGDIVTKGSETCACGMPFSTIRAIQGRMVDYFPLPNGRVIHPYEIVLILMREGAPWLRSYRLLQEREDRVLLYAVASVEPTRFQLDRLATAITAVLGRDVEFQVRLVPEIQLEESGKFRISRSLVRSNYDGIDWGPPSSG
jgi:phenylacetate-CoA ligase